MMKSKRLAFIILILLPFSLLAQNIEILKPLKVGDQISHLVFKNLENSKHKNLSAKDLHGKAVIIDFWTNGCVSCFEAMPKLEYLQKKYADSLQIILINAWEPKDKIIKRLQKMQSQRPDLKLPDLPNIYGDTTWRYIFAHIVVPHHVWIDRTGKVTAIINGHDATEENVVKLIRGSALDLVQKDDLKLRGKDARKQFLLEPFDSSLKREYYSSFFTSNLAMGASQLLQVDSVEGIFRRSIMNRSIVDLYKIACHIPPSDKRILVETSDSLSLFYPKDPSQLGKWAPNNCFTYEFVAPLTFKYKMDDFMLDDLNRYFGIKRGIKGGMETRSFTAYVFSIDSIKQIHTTSVPSIIENQNSFTYINQPVSNVFSYLRRHLEEISKPVVFIQDPIIDPTTLISVELPKNFDEIKDITTYFKKQGYTLSLENREIEILIIKKAK